MDAYKLLQKMTLGKNLTNTVRKAICSRLRAILEQKEKFYLRWTEEIKPKLNKTRQREIMRHQEKIIQALKIVIYELTPPEDRVEDMPTFFRKK